MSAALRYEYEQSFGKGKRTQWPTPIAQSLDPAEEYVAGPGNHLKPGRARAVKDNYPELQAAGAQPPERDVAGVKTSMIHSEISSYPPQQKPYRNEYRKQVGVRYISPGLVDLPLPPADKRLGVRTDMGERASAALRDAFLPENDLQATLLEHSESVYHSRQREPLGRSYSRGHRLPEAVGAAEFRFGVATTGSEPSNKLIYSQSAGNDEAKQREAELDYDHFRKEQPITKPLNRKYDWSSAKVDPVAFRFGRYEPVEKDGVAKSLKPESNAETKLVAVQVEQLKSVTHQPLGRTRAKRGTVAHLPDEHVFGRKSPQDEWGMRKLITGEYPAAEQQPDYNLGVSTRKLTQMPFIPPDDGSRVYGTPSIRVDAVAPATRTLGDTRNFGDEVDAMGLLFPSKYAMQGLREIDFLKQRSEDDIRQIFSSVTGPMSDAEFSNLCQSARDQFGELSVDSFRHVHNMTRPLFDSQSSGVSAQLKGSQLLRTLQQQPQAARTQRWGAPVSLQQ